MQHFRICCLNFRQMQRDLNLMFNSVTMHEMDVILLEQLESCFVSQMYTYL